MDLRCEALRGEMSAWKFPLHFIDFETMSPAIPFHQGRYPYGQLAFQFSHHVVHTDGRVVHRGEYIETGVGVFPNFDFLRALRKELECDEGTIFRYAAHENSILVAIHAQLRDDGEAVRDGEDLCNFIESITCPTSSGQHRWPTPERNMVDMLNLVKGYYYDPRMGGSNSIKKVLPAVLNSSQYLQQKYAKPIYGTQDGITSLNFQDKVWVQHGADGTVLDPYKLLPKLFGGASPSDQERLMTQVEQIREGGAAMTVYAKMQFTEMSDYERNTLQAALLKYCELDTLAMVMIYEAWREWC